MSQPEWVEICCVVPEKMADSLADFLLELTGIGVSIDNRVIDTFNIEDISEEPEKHVKGYLPADSAMEQTIALIDSFLRDNGPSFQGFIYYPPRVELLHENDWSNSWKVNFKPTRIGKRLVMKPSWEEFAAGGPDIVLELDPGMAFGTGTHATTRLCLEALEQLVFEEGAFTRGNSSVLDVGCGSGVLGIAAALFGAGLVTAIDIDPVAVSVTEENARINGVDGLLDASITPLEALSGDYAVVLGNILAEDLVRMGDALVARAMPGGFLVLSGILDEKEEHVLSGYAHLPVTLHTATRRDEWCCLVYRKNT